MNETEGPTRADDATAPAAELIPISYFIQPSLLARQRAPADSGRAGPDPAWLRERRQHALL